MKNIFRYQASSPETDPTRLRRFWHIAWRVFLGVFLFGFLATIALAIYVAKDLPNPNSVSNRALAESTKILDRTGNHTLYEIHGEEKRTIIPFEQMPEVIRAATITLEDQDFYSHHGIKLTSILRAVLKDVQMGGKAQGGSTITQQFIKNSLLSNEKTLTRKIKEVILSVELEQKYSKDEILAMYLNEIPYGSNAYGIQAAAQTFFTKDASDLTLDEAALIASLPQAPTYYSPYGSHIDALKPRQEYALDQMARLGYVTQEQADEAKMVDVLEKIAPQREAIAAPHFVMYVKEYLETKYGDESVERGGLRVYTSLDWDKQQIAEQAVSDGASKNTKYKAENASLVAMDPKTGQILAMVGSKNYFDKAIDGQVNVAIRDRQPGSSFKPYVYLTAFTKGFLPETMLYDVETNFSTDDGKTYTPQNYDGKFHGPIAMKRALGGSLNIPAVKTLYLTGVKDATDMAKSLGINGLNDPKRYGLSLVLGGGEVRLLDHVHAYATLATGGIKYPLSPILKIEDAKGEILEEYQSSAGERVVEEKYVAMLDSVLSDNSNRAWVFGDNNPLRFDNRPVVAKTGTTNEWRDGWTMGYTPSLAAGVWAGNNDNSPMAQGADGSYVAAPIWRAFMDKALTNYSVEEFPKYNPDDFIGEGEEKTNKPMLSGKMDEEKNLKVCEIPGKKGKYCMANKYCPDDESDKKDFVSAHDILYYVDKSDPRGPIPEKPSKDPQYKEWEKGVENWYEKDGPKHTIAEPPPSDECKESDFSKYKPSVSLSTSGSGQTISISVKADAPYGVDKLTISVDGSEITSSSSESVSTSYSVPVSKNDSTLSVKATIRDDNGNESSDSKDIHVSFPVGP